MNHKISIFALTISLLFIGLVAHSQSVDQIKANKTVYIWGEGTGKTLKQADNEALSALISQISSQVESKFELLKQEGVKEYSENYSSVINTYSSATLKNTDRIVLSDEPKAKIFRYLKRSEVDRIFYDRKIKLLEFARSAQESQLKNQIADALKYYYWALTLLKSHPDGSSITFKDLNGETQLLATWIPIQMNTIFSSVKVIADHPKSEGGISTVNLKITCNSKPVSNYDYTYWDGRNWSNIISAKDGLGYVELIGSDDIKEIKLKSEYFFEGESNVDSELKQVIEHIEPIPFRNSYITVKLGDSPNFKDIPVANTTPQDEIMEMQSVALQTLTKQEADQYSKIVEMFKVSIKNKNYDAIKDCFTPQGFEIFLSLIQYGRARILKETSLSFSIVDENVCCRSIPMAFNFENGDKQFVEDVVIHFNADKKIESIAFDLGQKSIADIFSKSVWSVPVRLAIIQFMEHYKTAYALKRIDYIQKIFADDALIIIGSLVQAPKQEVNLFNNNQIVRYNKYSKQEYLKKLQMSFNSNEFINIKFEENEVRKSGKGGEIYGIQIKQRYFSSHYGDTGYLFLMVDLNDTKSPVIHVRTWQPEKNPDGSIYGLQDF